MSRVRSTPSTVPALSPGCCSTRTPTRSGCPTRGCRSSTRSSTSVPMRWPSAPTPPGSTWRPPCGRRACRSSAWSSTCRRPPSTCWPSTCRPSSSTPTSSTCSTWPASRCTGRTAADADALVVAGGHCVYNPEPLADFVDAFVLGDGEEVVGEINEVMVGWLARVATRGARPRRAPARAGRARRGLRARALHPVLRGRPAGLDPPRRIPACPPRCRSGRSATWPTGRIPPARSSR